MGRSRTAIIPLLLAIVLTLLHGCTGLLQQGKTRVHIEPVKTVFRYPERVSFRVTIVNGSDRAIDVPHLISLADEPGVLRHAASRRLREALHGQLSQRDIRLAPGDSLVMFQDFDDAGVAGNCAIRPVLPPGPYTTETSVQCVDVETRRPIRVSAECSYSVVETRVPDVFETFLRQTCAVEENTVGAQARRAAFALLERLADTVLARSSNTEVAAVLAENLIAYRERRAAGPLDERLFRVLLTARPSSNTRMVLAQLFALQPRSAQEILLAEAGNDPVLVPLLRARLVP